MVRKTGVVKTLSTISLGVVLILFEIWMWTQVPEWQPQITIYILMTAFMFSFGVSKTERAIMNTSFLKAIPKMFIFFVATFLILFGFGKIIGGNALPTIAVGLASVPISLILIHGFIVSVDEELGFRGWLVDNLKRRGMNEKYVIIISSGIFALFHFFMAGGVWILLLPYFILGYIFYKVKMKYSPRTNTANMGVHFGWNVYILAFIEKI